MIYRLIVYIIVDVLNEEPLMKELLKKIRIKKNYKEFNRNSIHGEKLGLDFTSRCISDHREDIQIGNRCEIKGTLRSFQGGEDNNWRQFLHGVSFLHRGDGFHCNWQ